jgi:hypothetical protein
LGLINLTPSAGDEGRNSFKRCLTCDTLHGVDVEAFPLERQVLSIAFLTCLRTFGERFANGTS